LYYKTVQSYEKTSAEQKKLVCFLCRVPSKFDVKHQSYKNKKKSSIFADGKYKKKELWKTV